MFCNKLPRLQNIQIEANNLQQAWKITEFSKYFAHKLGRLLNIQNIFAIKLGRLLDILNLLADKLGRLPNIQN
jgi:hypothetical protein